MFILSANTDSSATQARDYNTAAVEADALAKTSRAKRDAIIRALRTEDPTTWTYTALAKAIGVSVYMVTKIIKSR